VILTPTDVLAATLKSLPPLENTVLEAHYIDGLSVLVFHRYSGSSRQMSEE
jgi:hypothetical protein